MIYIPIKIGLILGVCAKCASSSFRNEFTFKNIEPLSDVAVLEMKKSGWKVIGVVRDPIDRIESAYNFFQHGQGGTFPNGKKYETIDHFIESVLNGDKDKHWMPQAGQLLLCDEFIDLETFPLSTHINSAEHFEKISVEKLPALLDYYAADTGIRGETWQEL